MGCVNSWFTWSQRSWCSWEHEKVVSRHNTTKLGVSAILLCVVALSCWRPTMLRREILEGFSQIAGTPVARFKKDWCCGVCDRDRLRVVAVEVWLQRFKSHHPAEENSTIEIKIARTVPNLTGSTRPFFPEKLCWKDPVSLAVQAPTICFLFHTETRRPQNTIPDEGTSV